MRFFDPHIHVTSRTTDDIEAMAKAGVRAVIEPAFWLGQPRTNVGSFVDYFSSLLGWERFRCAQFGVAHYCAIGLNSKEANQERVADEVMEILPLYACKEGVVAIGEIGYDDMSDLEDRYFRKQLDLAREQDIESQRDRFLPFEKAQRELAIQRDILNALRARVAQEGIEIEVPRTPVDLVDPAEPPKYPFSPNLLLNILISLFLGIISGVGLAYFIEYLDTSVKTVDDVERYLQTSYHNTVCVNASDQLRRSGKTDLWFSNPVLDCVSGVFAGYPNVSHRRAVLFVKPEA